MKKILIWLLVLTMLLLAGCGADPQNTDPTNTEPSSSETNQGGDDKVDFSKYANKVNVLCYNVFYKNVDASSYFYKIIEDSQKIMKF